MTYWLVNATLLVLIWRTTITVEFAVMTTFLILFKFLGYLRGFDNCGWLLRVLNQVWCTAIDDTVDCLLARRFSHFVVITGSSMILI
jgi:hypothetical protein